MTGIVIYLVLRWEISFKGSRDNSKRVLVQRFTSIYFGVNPAALSCATRMEPYSLAEKLSRLKKSGRVGGL